MSNELGRQERMSGEVIPAEAVEAARKVAFERYGTKPDAAYLRTILEAAAPHMLAGVISNRLELEALWLGSVVLSEGVSYQRYGSDEWYGEGCPYGSREIKLPAIVLHNPNPYRPTP